MRPWCKFGLALPIAVSPNQHESSEIWTRNNIRRRKEEATMAQRRKNISSASRLIATRVAAKAKKKISVATDFEVTVSTNQLHGSLRKSERNMRGQIPKWMNGVHLSTIALGS